MRLDERGEFGLIARIARLAARVPAPGVVLGIGDDAALLRARRGEDVAVTADTLVEGVHFRLDREAARNVGRRALLANLSDLAAVGARPLGCTLALAAPPGLDERIALALVRGLLDVGRREACPLVGGNVTRAREVSLAVTAVGAVPRGRALRRSAARSGERLLVTGALGAAALARARAARRGGRRRDLPPCRVAAGRALARTPGIGACIDVSDGLLADLRHLLAASGVGAEIDAQRVPRPRGFDAACRRLGLEPDRLALAGGEDYELLFSAGARAPDAARLRARLGVPVSEIGRITRARGLRVERARGGSLGAGGWRHF